MTPNISPARECDNSGNTVGILSKYDKDTYYQNIKKAFPTFNTESIYDIEHTDNHQFCYAGSWCFQVDFTTGMYSQCLRNAGPKYNFFENIEQELILEPVGTGCRAPYCLSLIHICSHKRGQSSNPVRQWFSPSSSDCLLYT